jgi:hypothetical protein
MLMVTHRLIHHHLRKRRKFREQQKVRKVKGNLRPVPVGSPACIIKSEKLLMRGEYHEGGHLNL